MGRKRQEPPVWHTQPGAGQMRLPAPELVRALQGTARARSAREQQPLTMSSTYLTKVNGANSVAHGFAMGGQRHQLSASSLKDRGGAAHEKSFVASHHGNRIWFDGERLL